MTMSNNNTDHILRWTPQWQRENKLWSITARMLLIQSVKCQTSSVLTTITSLTMLWLWGPHSKKSCCCETIISLEVVLQQGFHLIICQVVGPCIKSTMQNIGSIGVSTTQMVFLNRRCSLSIHVAMSHDSRFTRKVTFVALITLQLVKCGHSRQKLATFHQHLKYCPQKLCHCAQYTGHHHRGSFSLC